MSSGADEQRDQLTPEMHRSLRERAEKALAQPAAEHHTSTTSLTCQDLQRLIHELQVHQLELELQNEELRQAQLALEDSRDRYLGLYNLAPIGYILANKVGLILEANRTFADWLGVSRDSLIERPLNPFMFADDQDIYYFLCQRLIETTLPQTCELRLQNTRGICCWVQLSATLATEHPHETNLRIALIDITDRKRAEAARDSLEAQLRESQKMEAVGTLAGGIAHDFNNILAIILGNVELAMRFTDPLSGGYQYIHEIQQAALRARELVKQIVSFSRCQSSDRKLISLPQVVREAVNLLRPMLPPQVNLSFACGSAIPSVLANATQIEQVVVNLVSNAMQAMQARAGNITIRLDLVSLASQVAFAPCLRAAQWKTYEQVVRLMIQDDGPGMDDKVMARVFEPFFTTKAVDEGTGLGLAVVNGIVLAHAGAITVTSRPGQGSTFTVYLPPATTPFEAAGPPAA